MASMAVSLRVHRILRGEPIVSKYLSHPWLGRLGFPILVALIAAGMAASFARHGGPMLRAASGLSPGALALALLLSVIYRVVNAGGWGLILRALGEPVRAVPAARIWLASEACRWLPGSLWSFGSRAVLATRRGLAGPTVAASLALELAVTVVAWAVVAAIGGSRLRVPAGWIPGDPASAAAWASAGVVLACAGGAWALRSSRFRDKLDGLMLRFRDLRRAGVSWAGLFRSLLFYVAMAIVNGATLLVIVRSSPGGASCPASGVIAANAVAWLAGFFAIFAPGGLVVREASLAAMLAPWMAPEQAIVVALAWRLVQVAAEAACFGGVVAWGLPGSLKVEPLPAVNARGRPGGPSVDGQSRRPGDSILPGRSSARS